MENIVNLNNLAGGGVAEQFNRELLKVLENIADPNTDAKKARKITLTVTLKADDERDIANVSFETKSSLAPAKTVGTKIIMDLDSKGRVTGAELKSGVKGQTYITEDGEIEDDRGNKIISFK